MRVSQPPVGAGVAAHRDNGHATDEDEYRHGGYESHLRVALVGRIVFLVVIHRAGSGTSTPVWYMLVFRCQQSFQRRGRHRLSVQKSLGLNTAGPLQEVEL